MKKGIYKAWDRIAVRFFGGTKTEEAFGVRVPISEATKERLRKIEAEHKNNCRVCSGDAFKKVIDGLRNQQLHNQAKTIHPLHCAANEVDLMRALKPDSLVPLKGEVGRLYGLDVVVDETMKEGEWKFGGPRMAKVAPDVLEELKKSTEEQK